MIKNSSAMLNNKSWNLNYENTYTHPHIPYKKLINAISSYANDATPEDSLILLDDTVFGGSKEGLLLTEHAIYAKEIFKQPRKILINKIEEVSSKKNILLINGDIFFEATIIEHGAIFSLSKIIYDAIKNKKNNDPIIVYFFSAIAKFAKIDGKICKHEIKFIEDCLEQMNIKNSERKNIIEIFNKAKNDINSFEFYMEKFSEHSTKNQKEIFYETLCCLAESDGEVSHEEYIALKITREKLKIIKRQSDSDSDSDIKYYYKILNANPSDTIQEIKIKYRKAASQFHPDKIQSKDLPDAFIEFANDQLKKINNAYDGICAHRKGGK